MTETVDLVVCFVVRKTPFKNTILAVQIPTKHIDGSLGHLWEVPHGLIEHEKGESPEEAAHRLVRRAFGSILADEANFRDDVLSGPLMHVTRNHSFRVHAFFAELIEFNSGQYKELKPARDAREAKWVPINNTIDMDVGTMTFPTYLREICLQIYDGFRAAEPDWFDGE